MDPTSVGYYGTLMFLRAKDPEQVVTAYPIDTQTVTIGREPSCDIRLYYPDVSALHAKIVFQDRKAFIVVLGQHGLLVDDCPVFPSDTPTRPTTIPLANGSILEIRSKRFRFEYPPKHARAAAAAALSTPAPTRRRLSLITASKVFSPAPSSRPAENLRILQSPLRPYAGMVRQPSPLRGRGAPPSPEEDEDVEDEEVVLVDGDHPSVVQEDKDLVIMEQLPPIVPTGGTPRHLAPESVQQTLQTPRRKPTGRPSLHRAVLIRSAHRVVQDCVDEMEVEHSVLLEGDVSDESDILADEEDAEEDVEDDGEVMEEAYERVRDDGEEPRPAITGWRQSVGSVWPFGRKTEDRAGEADDNDELDALEQADGNIFDGERVPDDDEGMEEEGDSLFVHDEPEPQPVEEQSVAPPAMAPPTTPIASRRLGQFMTPQAPQVAPFAPSTAVRPMHTPRRAVDAWRVRDIVVPANPPQAAPAPRPSTSRKVSVEEEKQIRDRRKSAMIASLSPHKATAVPKPLSAPREDDSPPAAPSAPTRRAPRESDESDSGALLASMRRTVDDLRRRSLGTTLTPAGTSPRKKGGFSIFPAPRDEVPVMKGALDFGKVSEDSDSSMAVDEDEDDEASNPLHSLPLPPPSLPATSDKPIAAVARPPVSRPPPPPETPDLAPLRHMFAAPHRVGAATPAVKSVRGLYAQPRVPDTPSMEGMAEMLAPPAAEPEPTPTSAMEVEAAEPSGTSETSALNTAMPLDNDMSLSEPKPDPAPAAVKPRKPPSSRSATTQAPLRKLASKEASSSQPPAKAPRAAPARAARTVAQVTPNASTMADDEMTPAVPEPAPRPPRKTADAGPSTKPAAAAVRRRRPPGVRPEELGTTDASRPPSRATDTTADSANEEISKPTATKAAKPPSKAKATAPSSAPARRVRSAETAPTEPAPPSSAPAPARRATRSTPVRETASTAASTEDDAGATRVRRAARGKGADVAPVPEEDEDVVPANPRAPSRSGIKTPAPSTASRTRPATRKTPAAGASSESTAAGDKENTPDGGSTSATRGDDDSESSGGNAKKATRARSLKTPAAKEKDDAPAPARASRVTRAKK